MAKRERVRGPIARPDLSGPPPLTHIAEQLRHLAIPIDQLTPDPDNARRHDARNISAIVESLNTFGQRAPLVAQRQRDGRLVVRAGNGRLQAALRLGWEVVAVVEIAEGDAAAAAFALADNRTAELAAWDDEQLAKNLSALRGEEELFGATGYREEELDALLKGLADDVLRDAPPPPADEDGDGADGEADHFEEAERGPRLDEMDEPEEDASAFEPPAVAITQPGDLWLLGEHRLLCGDSTSAADVARLMEGERINVAFTSPPYASQRKYDESSGFKPIHPDDYVEWFEAIQSNVARHLADDGSWFVNIKEHSEDGQRHLYVKDLTIAHVRKWGWLFVDEFCWRNTANGVPGVWPNRFKNAWEPIFHYAKNKKIKMCVDNVLIPTQGAFQYGERGESKTGTPFPSGGSHKEGWARPSNVVEAKPAQEGLHSAPFPVALPRFFVAAFTEPGDVVFEPFCGSGTTLIAAEMLKRRCFGMEISARYCDVIVARWESLTERKAIRVPAK